MNEPKNPEGLMTLMRMRGIEMPSFTEREIRLYATLMAEQERERGAVQQRLTDACQAEDGAAVSADLLRAARMLLEVAEQWQVGYSARVAMKAAIKRAENEQGR